ncbi:hypothetical protein [Streptomyces sp. CMB-StM0423]|uniref:hypothetical protein n=1 Tax=Streptomyces sp. CMB-StM0423 TaxID=2059884 RepID=UPI000C70F508|nr:hypothetical protein [Streptomyces sp. CMB-StM0423]AUH43210.1 hypothetical protein CXR04_26300 [Streptomyces sp. CMB-StM0423]
MGNESAVTPAAAEAAVGARTADLYVRKDNLLVRVWYPAARPEGARRAALESVARTVLVQYGCPPDPRPAGT